MVVFPFCRKKRKVPGLLEPPPMYLPSCPKRRCRKWRRYEGECGRRGVVSDITMLVFSFRPLSPKRTSRSELREHLPTFSPCSGSPRSKSLKRSAFYTFSTASSTCCTFFFFISRHARPKQCSYTAWTVLGMKWKLPAFFFFFYFDSILFSYPLSRDDWPVISHKAERQFSHLSPPHLYLLVATTSSRWISWHPWDVYFVHK